MRLLIMIAGIIVLLLLFRSLLPRPRTRPRQGSTPEKMVSCTWCKLYLPESEALHGNGQFFCNREHHSAWLEDQRGKKN
jgi:uncharacterized protein